MMRIGSGQAVGGDVGEGVFAEIAQRSAIRNR